LLTVLRSEGFTQFAQELEGPAGEGIRGCSNRLIVFAPTNAGLARRATCSPVQRRGDTEPPSDDEAKADASQNVVGETKYDDRRRATITTTPGAVSFLTWLNDPRFVNLGGQNSSIVQVNRPNAALPIVLSGLGDSVKVTGLDIPFDCGVIRPISADLTLPRLITQTLPFLANDKLLAILQRTGLAAELDNRTSITFLAPDDTVLPDRPDAELVQVLREHILLGSPAYTPLLVNGATYATLAGTTVSVEIRGPDFFVGGAKILNGDAIVKNGVVHTVDRLISASTGTSTASATGTRATSPIVTGAAATVGLGSFQVTAVKSLGLVAAVGYVVACLTGGL
ncbi:FAS1 domain-containing protein, partial [Cercophora newfieldiana]